MTVIIEDIKTPRKVKAKKSGRAKLIKKADTLCSLFVRKFFADKDGRVECYTCSFKAHWKRMQNGHCITRSRYFTRWVLSNLRPQCFVCNMRNQGMTHVFREKLVREYGEVLVQANELASKRDNKEFTDEMIQDHIFIYETLLLAL